MLGGKIARPFTGAQQRRTCRDSRPVGERLPPVFAENNPPIIRSVSALRFPPCPLAIVIGIASHWRPALPLPGTATGIGKSLALPAAGAL